MISIYLRMKRGWANSVMGGLSNSRWYRRNSKGEIIITAKHIQTGHCWIMINLSIYLLKKPPTRASQNTKPGKKMKKIKSNKEPMKPRGKSSKNRGKEEE